MDWLFKELKRIAMTLLVIDGIALIVAAFVNSLDSTIFFGLALGNIFTLGQMFLLANVVTNALSREAGKAEKFMRLHYGIRYALIGMVMAVGFTSPNTNGWCVVVSLLAPKITYTVAGFSSWLKNKYDD